MAREFWEGKCFSYFQNRECEYFPCHEGADEGNFNCLFCYCPLYALGENCGGAFTILPNGYKDCSRCLFPHRRENFGKVTERYKEIQALAAAQMRPGPAAAENAESLGPAAQ